LRPLVVVVNFISGLLNNINNKEITVNQKKKDTATKRYMLKHAQAEKNYDGKRIHCTNSFLNSRVFIVFP